MRFTLIRHFNPSLVYYLRLRLEPYYNSQHARLMSAILFASILAPEIRHYDNTYKDLTYNDFTYNSR